jgi:ABC-2 type transport system ATP-binding protein
MPVDRPRRALVEEPDDVESYVARRSFGFTAADDGDQIVARPARAARALEPAVTTDQSDESDHTSFSDLAPRPRRALLAEPLSPAADQARRTATDAGISGPTTEPVYGRYVQPALPPEPAAAVVTSRFEEGPQPRRSAPSPSFAPEVEPPTVSAYAPRRQDSVPVPPQPAALPATPVSSVARQAPPITTAAPVAPSMTTAVPVRAPILELAAMRPPMPEPAPVPSPMPQPAALQSPMPEPAAMQPPANGVRHTRRARSTLHHDVPPIIVDRLIKSYNGTLAVHNLSFVVEPGRVTGFLGPNGAGKTTTMRILVGLATPTTGTATFGELAYAELPHPQQTVGCVLDASFHPARSGRNHLRVLAPTAGASDRRVDELLDEVGLDEVARQPVGEYSMGMRQRLALAAAMLGNPDYLILDEPANGLDPEGIRWLRTFLRDFAASGRAVLISSHQLNEIEANADDIVVINRGRLLAQMPMSELNLGESTTRARVSDMRAAVHALATIGADAQTAADEHGAFLRIHSDDVGQVGSVLFSSGIVVDELLTERRDLEQEFFSMLEGSR